MGKEEVKRKYKRRLWIGIVCLAPIAAVLAIPTDIYVAFILGNIQKVKITTVLGLELIESLTILAREAVIATKAIILLLTALTGLGIYLVMKRK